MAETEQQSIYLDYFYSACEATGAFLGNLHAKILDSTADYIAIGAKGFKKGKEQYVNYISDSVEDVKTKLKSKTISNDEPLE